ncbi:MAG: Na/Pi cotransporter family protein, partial [Candidatus Electrothrix sp. AR5]|nr:Na/Pi cotransporter family protein [Candidatus Electrothrix sp. AR5]
MLFLGITGGLAFFLYGMELMSEGLKKTAGNKMRSILAALTKNRFIGLLMGAFVTTVIQSSG